MKKISIIISILIVPLLMTACASGDEIKPLVVSYDGEECVVTGPTELPAGEHIVIFIDTSEQDAHLSISTLLEGKTTQDLIDLQSYPGEYMDKPSWVKNDRNGYKLEETKDGRVFTHTYYLNDVGEHAIYCWNYSPDTIWFAASLTIVEK